MADPLTMTNDEAQDFLASMCKPEDAGRLGAAIRGIRAKAVEDAKAWYGTDDDMDPQRLAQALHATGLNTIGRKAGSHGAYTDTCICNPDAADICIAYRGAALRSTPAAPADGYTETNRHADRIWAAAQVLNEAAETEEQSGAINDLLSVANALRSTPAAPKEDDRE